MKQRIQYFPVTMFSIVMGLTGLTLVLGKFYHMQWLNKGFYEIFLFLHLGVFALITGIYGFKTLRYFGEVLEDFRHKIKINFFSAISISFLLQSVAFLSYWPQLSRIFWVIGVVLHTFLMFHTISFWISHNFEINFMNPAWFIPVVGSIIVPIAGVEFMPIEFNYFYFSAGFFFWIILFTIFLNRAIFHQQLPQKFIPTLFILIAPPAIGFLSWLRLTGDLNFFAYFLLSISYVFFILLFFLRKSFSKLKFFISWWAFTFPLDAITLASATAFEHTGLHFYRYLTYGLFVITVLTILYVSVLTIAKIRKGELCVKEE